MLTAKELERKIAYHTANLAIQEEKRKTAPAAMKHLRDARIIAIQKTLAKLHRQAVQS